MQEPLQKTCKADPLRRVCLDKPDGMKRAIAGDYHHSGSRGPDGSSVDFGSDI